MFRNVFKDVFLCYSMKYFLIILVLSVFLLAGCSQEDSRENLEISTNQDLELEEGSVVPDVKEEVVSPTVHEMTVSNGWFVPQRIEIKKGDTVRFVNTGKMNIWPASNPHPEHTHYPGSSILKCKTESDKIFDACRPLRPGEEFSFTFKEEGAWIYHNHLAPDKQATIVVR